MQSGRFQLTYLTSPAITRFPHSADRAIGFTDCLVNGPVPPTVAGWRWSGGLVGSPNLYDATSMPRLTATGTTAFISFFHLVEEAGLVSRYFPSVLRLIGVTNSQPAIYVQLTAPWPTDRTLVLQRSDDGTDVYGAWPWVHGGVVAGVAARLTAREVAVYRTSKRSPRM